MQHGATQIPQMVFPFRSWWYFDTNCLSELIKEHRQGNSAVRALLHGRDVLVSCTNILEIRQRPDLCRDLDRALAGAHVYLLPDIWAFWDAEIADFANVGRGPLNSLNVQPWIRGLLARIYDHPTLSLVADKVHAQLDERFLAGLAPDVGARVDERDFGIWISQKIAKFAEDRYGLTLDPLQVTAARFPSFYTYFYTYFFRYMLDPMVVPEINDAIDLTNSLPLPYCVRYYGERAFVNVLRRVKGHRPPPPWSLVTRAEKKHGLAVQTRKVLWTHRDALSEEHPLLTKVELYSLAELREHLQV